MDIFGKWVVFFLNQLGSKIVSLTAKLSSSPVLTAIKPEEIKNSTLC